MTPSILNAHHKPKYSKGSLIKNTSGVVMMWFLITTLKFCIHLITRIIKTCKGGSRTTQKNQETQTDISIYPMCRDSLHKSTSTFPTPKARGFSAKSCTDKRESDNDKGNGAEPILCPKCRESMLVKRAYKGGTFYGCSKWPECRGSKYWKDVNNNKLENEHCSGEINFVEMIC